MTVTKVKTDSSTIWGPDNSRSFPPHKDWAGGGGEGVTATRI
jgi:hypothetical protein